MNTERIMIGAVIKYIEANVELYKGIVSNKPPTIREFIQFLKNKKTIIDSMEQEIERRVK